MSGQRVTRRNILRKSGTALATLTGLSMAGNATAAPGEGGGGGGGGGGSSGTPPTVDTVRHDYGPNGEVTTIGNLMSLGSAGSVDVWFEFGPVGTGLQNYTALQTMSSTGFYCDGYGAGMNCPYDRWASLDPGTYEWRAIAQGDGVDRSHDGQFTI